VSAVAQRVIPCPLLRRLGSCIVSLLAACDGVRQRIQKLWRSLHGRAVNHRLIDCPNRSLVRSLHRGPPQDHFPSRSPAQWQRKATCSSDTGCFLHRYRLFARSSAAVFSAGTDHLRGPQILFSLFGFVFCVTMLVMGKQEGVYLPILTSIIGVWTPSPLSAGRDRLAQTADNPIPRSADVSTPHPPSTPGGDARSAALLTGTSTMGLLNTPTRSTMQGSPLHHPVPGEGHV
jgi:hypothetical protein